MKINDIFLFFIFFLFFIIAINLSISGYFALISYLVLTFSLIYFLLNIISKYQLHYLIIILGFLFFIYVFFKMTWGHWQPENYAAISYRGFGALKPMLATLYYHQNGSIDLGVLNAAGTKVNITSVEIIETNANNACDHINIIKNNNKSMVFPNENFFIEAINCPVLTDSDRFSLNVTIKYTDGVYPGYQKISQGTILGPYTKI